MTERNISNKFHALSSLLHTVEAIHNTSVIHLEVSAERNQYQKDRTITAYYGKIAREGFTIQKTLEDARFDRCVSAYDCKRVGRFVDLVTQEEQRRQVTRLCDHLRNDINDLVEIFELVTSNKWLKGFDDE